MDHFGVMASRETSKFILLLNSTTDAIKYDNSMRNEQFFFLRSFDSIFIYNLIKIHLFRMFSSFSALFYSAISVGSFFIKFFFYESQKANDGFWALYQ